MTWFADDVVKVEVRFDGSTWVNLSSPTNYVILSEPLQIERGRDDEFADPMNPGVLELLLVNDDGRFTPDLPTSPYYPYVVPDVAIKVSVYVNSAWQTRFYGSVQSWSVRLGDEGGYTSTCAVTATDTLGDFPEYVFRQAADEVVRNTPSVVCHWPLRDAQGPTARTLVGSETLAGASANGWGQSTAPLLPLEEGDEQHPVFTGAAGGLQLTSDLFAVRAARFVLYGAPTGDATLLTVGHERSLSWTTASGLSVGGASIMPASYPALVEMACVDVDPGTTVSPQAALRVCGANGVVQSAAPSGAWRIFGGGLRGLVVNPVLSGGAQWSIGHLQTVNYPSLDITDQETAFSAAAVSLLGSRTPPSTSAPALVASFAGAPTVSGATAGETTLPNMDGRDAADVMAALALGTGARIRDNLDGTLQWIEFTPSATPTTMPSEKIDPALTWETTTVGWMSDCTVTETDGTAYTATRTDGKRASYSIEGVHATALQNRSYADWLVNTASTKARLSQATYEISSLSDANQAIVAGVKIGDRITIGSLPSAILPASLTLIVEGITDSISYDGWTVTLKTSPDVYSRLLIWDNAQNWDDGWIWAP